MGHSLLGTCPGAGLCCLPPPRPSQGERLPLARLSHDAPRPETPPVHASGQAPGGSGREGLFGCLFGGSANTAAFLQRYQAKLLTELAASLGTGHETVVELRRATDLSLRLTRCTSQALGRVMGASVAIQRSLWLSLARLTDREKAPLLDASKFEEQQKSQEAFQAWMPRSSGSEQQSSSGQMTPGQKRSGFRSPAPPAKMPTRRGWQRHPFSPATQPPAQQQPAVRSNQSAAQAPRQHAARRGKGQGRLPAT